MLSASSRGEGGGCSGCSSHPPNGYTRDICNGLFLWYCKYNYIVQYLPAWLLALHPAARRKREQAPRPHNTHTHTTKGKEPTVQ